MKKHFVLCLFLVLLLTSLSANSFAIECKGHVWEADLGNTCQQEEGAGQRIDLNETCAVCGARRRAVSPIQDVYVPVTIIREQADGSIVTSTIYPAVVRVQYKYYAAQSEVTGTFTGGYVELNEEYPRLTAIAEDYLGVSAARVSYPTVGDVSYSNDQYTVSIRGGSFTITYHATVRYNAQGQIVSATPATVTRVYNYSETGP